MWNPPPAGGRNCILYQSAELTASDGELDAFGGSVSLSGNTLVVGAGLAKINGHNDQGAAFVFIGSGASWCPSRRAHRG